MQNHRPGQEEPAADRQEPKDRPQQQAETGVDSEQTLAWIDGKEQQAGRQNQTEQQVQKPGQAGTEPPEAPQQIVA